MVQANWIFQDTVGLRELAQAGRTWRFQIGHDKFPPEQRVPLPLGPIQAVRFLESEVTVFENSYGYNGFGVRYATEDQAARFRPFWTLYFRILRYVSWTDLCALA